jgi:hypothetical protein
LTVCCARATTPATGFAGTWVMTLDGQPLMVLTLKPDKDRFVGSLARPRRMTSDGRSFSGISGETISEPVTTDAPSGTSLRLVSTEPNPPNDKTTFDMTLITVDEARLKIADAPFEPWPIARHGGSEEVQVWSGWDEKRSYALRAPYVAPNAEMAAIYKADQAVRQSVESFRANARQIEQEDMKRREQTHALISKGELRAAEDFRLAAMVYQHGSSPRDYLFAHTLAMIAMSKGDRSAAWIASASLDRYLHSINQPQIFGSQFGFDGKSQGAFDAELLSDDLRRDLGIPTVAEQQAQMQKVLKK